MATFIETLRKGLDQIAPRTKTKAVSDDNGNNLDDILTEIESDIPTQLSQLSDDSTHRLVTDTEKTAWNGKQSKITASGILKGDGTGGVSAAVAGVDYMSATNPRGTGTFAVGNNVTASGDYAHAEGQDTLAKGEASHAEGGATTARGANSHAEGARAQALGGRSHAEGQDTVARGSCQHVQGKCNVEDTSVYADIIGNGTSSSDRKNIEATTWTGDKRLKGDVYVHCNDDSTGGSKLMTEAITDAGGYFTTDTVEGALQEIGAELAGINTLIGTGVI